jgi:hypothetical protein
MARYRRSARRRTPIKSTKTYKKGMWTAAGLTAVALAFFPDAYGLLLQQANKLKSMFNGGGA